MKKHSKVKTYHLSEQTCKQISILSYESGESATAIVEQAINYLYQRDDIPENVIIGRLSAIDAKLKMIEIKEENFFSLSRLITQYFLAALPDMFESKEAFLMITEKGKRNLERLESMYRKHA